ncbi:hypothetical protein [Lysinibacillus sphaericus]|uniref:Uncharacterized protein n=1 Tax=Lysinibacillus sphaericus OT4b.31 TaxID=1285586 RepID=R7ZE13_LYSSH|nr:hypothetical protein [Lysinibacillus sphaericus]EON72380.1 hypothetical protein H131_12443 [Lysinibacillus sphaericus OT4b.31]
MKKQIREVGMHIEKSVSALLHYKCKTVVEITWENTQTSLYEIDTYYDSDKGLEMKMKIIKNIILH